jgi:hypothetical protein
MTVEVVENYKGYEIVAFWACGEIQGYFGNSIMDATRFYTPAATTLAEIKADIDNSWKLRNEFKIWEYKIKCRAKVKKNDFQK